MIKGKEASFDLDYRQFTFPHLRLITGQSDKTLRNWQTRYFSKFGVQTEGRRYLFSASECIVLRMFSELVTRFSVPPEIGSQLVNDLFIRIEYLQSLHGQLDDYEPEYLAIHEITAEECGFSIETRQSIASSMESELYAALIVPIDGYYWASLAELEVILRHSRQLTTEEVRAEASEIMGESGN